MAVIDGVGAGLMSCTQQPLEIAFPGVVLGEVIRQRVKHAQMGHGETGSISSDSGRKKRYRAQERLQYRDPDRGARAGPE